MKAQISEEEHARRARQRLLSYQDLRDLKGIKFSRQWVLKLIKADRFPRPVKYGLASVGFVESEIDDWIEGLIEERDGGVAA